jgi:hypothetical protein
VNDNFKTQCDEQMLPIFRDSSWPVLLHHLVVATPTITILTRESDWVFWERQVSRVIARPSMVSTRGISLLRAVGLSAGGNRIFCNIDSDALCLTC